MQSENTLPKINEKQVSTKKATNVSLKVLDSLELQILKFWKIFLWEFKTIGYQFIQQCAQSNWERPPPRLWYSKETQRPEERYPKVNSFNMSIIQKNFEILTQLCQDAKQENYELYEINRKLK